MASRIYRHGMFTSRYRVVLFVSAALLVAGAAGLAALLLDHQGSASSESKLRISAPSARTPVAVGESDIVPGSVRVSDSAEGWVLSFQLTQPGSAKMQELSAALDRAVRAGRAAAPRLAFDGHVYEQARVILQAPPEPKAVAVIQVAGLSCPAAQRLASEIGGENRVACEIGPGVRPLPRLPATAVSAGNSYTCARTRIGGLECWGDDRFGQLGNGIVTTPGQSTPQPVPVKGLRRGALAVSAGAQTACALLRSRRVSCWGFGLSGQLGADRRVNSPIPVAIAGVEGARAIVVADTHACALVRSGVDCWGLDDQGQLGDGRVSTVPRPAHVEGLGSGVRSLAAGGIHTCAVTRGGRVACWGFNGSGQLGDGTRANRTHPVLVRGLDKIVEVAAGGLHTCALTVGGMVECWGSNVSGEVGGTDKESLRARIVTGLSMASAIAVGDSQSCAVTTAGGVECWGSNAHGGEHGLRSMPVKVHGFHGKVVSLAVGSSHTCALLRAGSVECWGDNDKGQLGGGNAGTPSSRPVPVIGFGQ